MEERQSDKRRILGHRWFVLIIAACLGCAAHAAYGDHYDPQSFRQNYLEAERLARAKLFHNLRIECLERGRRVDSANRKRIYVLGEARVAVNTYLAEKPLGGVFGSVHGINSVYSFRLQQNRKSGPYVLKELQKDGMANPLIRRSFGSHVDMIAFAPFCVSGIPFSEILGDPAVTITAVRAAGREEEGVDDLLEVELHAGISASPSAMSGLVRVNPKHDWRIESYRNIHGSPPAEASRSYFASSDREYTEWPAGVIFPKAIRLFLAEAPDQTGVCVMDVVVNDVGVDELDEHPFKLSAYGISEPVEAEPAGRINVYLILLLIGSVLAFAIAALMRRRSSASS